MGRPQYRQVVALFAIVLKWLHFFVDGMDHSVLSAASSGRLVYTSFLWEPVQREIDFTPADFPDPRGFSFSGVVNLTGGMT